MADEMKTQSGNNEPVQKEDIKAPRTVPLEGDDIKAPRTVTLEE